FHSSPPSPPYTPFPPRRSSDLERDQRYRDHWRWGAVAGFYHFSLRDLEFIDAERKLEQLREYKAEGDSPPLLTSNDGLDVVEPLDRKSTRLNSSHVKISYAVFC